MNVLEKIPFKKANVINGILLQQQQSLCRDLNFFNFSLKLPSIQN